MSAENQRNVVLARLEDGAFDVLIIGGGIVGAGIARDAALRGLKTALVEQHDFAFGTSSRSSRLLHGGLRYLAQGRIGLVREASVEKNVLRQIAPHLAAPLPLVFPAYRGNPDWRLWQLKLGVKVYDLLCGGHNFGRSSWLDHEEVLREVPGLRCGGLSGAVRYFDGFTNDARLVLDTLRSAVKAGAAVVNYCRFQGASPLRATGWTCEVEDALIGKRLPVLARNVVNATGPWAGGLPRSQVKLRLTKGIHLVVGRNRLPVTEAVVMTEGRRILFAIPWGERTILGTTDTDFTGSPDQVTCDAADIRSLLQVANHFFPDVALTSADVVSSWAGLRPLLADRNGAPSDISRAHEIANPEPGWWDVAGGKLTTHRLMAEQTVDKIVAVLKRTSATTTNLQPCRTAEEPLLTAGETDGISGVLPPEFCRRVVGHGCANEWVVHLEDVMVRRTNWQHYHSDAALKAGQVADWMGELLAWTAERRAAELLRYLQGIGASGCS